MCADQRTERQSDHVLWHQILPWVLVVFWAGVIFFMSAKTGSDLIDGDDLISRVKRLLNDIQTAWFGPGVDIASSLAHFCEFTVFGALLQNAFRGHVRPWIAVGLAILVGSLYGITDEIHQLFVPDRACDPIDWLVDTAGALLGALVAYAVTHGRRRRRRKES